MMSRMQSQFFQPGGVARIFLFLCFLSVPGYAEEDRKLFLLSLDKLMSYEVTTVSRRPEKVSQTAAAIFVIKQEDIARSGAQTLPEVLRMVPGLQVARVSPSQWAISARGFNDVFSNKLLVQIDGRSVYSPVFSGVYWDMQDVVLADISRIEVIRGPGGALWGANAVSGIINIITKNSGDTQGAEIKVGAGNQVRGLVSARSGFQVSNDTTMRVSAKGFDQRGYNSPLGELGEWQRGQFGLRADSRISETLQATVLSDIQWSKQDPTVAEPLTPRKLHDYRTREFDILMKLIHEPPSGIQSNLEGYIDAIHRNDLFGEQNLAIFDLDYTGHYRHADGAQLVFGAKSRLIQDEIELAVPVSIQPEDRNTNFLSGFFNSESNFMDDSLRLTIGSKIERNSYSGFEIQPTVRVVKLFSPSFTAWGSVSRAVRRPNRVTHDMNIVVASFEQANEERPTFISLLGNRGVESENLLAYEFGLRTRPSDAWAIDIAAFWHDLEDIVSTNTGSPYLLPDGRNVVPLELSNAGKANSYGLEVLADYSFSDLWRAQASYTYLQTSTENAGTVLGDPPGTQANTSPRHSGTLRLLGDISDSSSVMMFWRYVGSLESNNIPSYNELNIRLSFSLTDSVEFSILGNNLLSSEHLEFVPTLGNSAPIFVERSIGGVLRVHF